jgi:hypothetical protein
MQDAVAGMTFDEELEGAGVGAGSSIVAIKSHRCGCVEANVYQRLMRSNRCSSLRRYGDLIPNGSTINELAASWEVSVHPTRPGPWCKISPGG